MLLTNSCRKALKDVNDYFPKIKLVSATVQANGSVLLTGEIESKGGSAIEHLGFCFNYSNPPTMLDNQISLTAGSVFSAEVSGVSVDSVYYFRAWAANSFGYSYSNVISLDSIIASPVIPSCSLSVNTIDFGGGFIENYSNVEAPVTSNGETSFDGTTSSGHSVSFVFGSTITTGTYTTTSDPSPSNGEIHVRFVSGALNPGTKVYVNTVSPGVFDLTVCNAPWTANFTTFTFNSRCTVPY